MREGNSFTSTLEVGEMHLAQTVGSGNLPVFSTPSMIALMENASMLCVQGKLSEGKTTVGSGINIKHIKPTLMGKTVHAQATLISIENNRLTFSVKAWDQEGDIGNGEHVRFIVDKENFLNKTGV